MDLRPLRHGCGYAIRKLRAGINYLDSWPRFKLEATCGHKLLRFRDGSITQTFSNLWKRAG